MPAVRKLWHLLPHQDAAIRTLAATAKVSPVVAQLLLNRGVSDPVEARRFLDSPLTGLHPPQMLPGVTEAATRLVRAIISKERICIFGDYDADGVTGTAILVKLIDLLGGTVEFYIPLRLEEGYGLNADAIRQKHADGVRLMITVDCGITAIEEARVAKEIGLDLIITDHHELRDELPEALIVHPRRPGGSYPFGGLSGSGVALKLAWAVAQLVSNSDRVTPILREFLLDAVGVAALGLVADVVPLKDENRVLVRHGLVRLTTHPPLGLKALIETAGMNGEAIRAEDVSFRIAPRLNAAGRLGCALLVVELLTTKVPARARDLAIALDGYNQQRQTLERRMVTQAKEMVEAGGHHADAAIVLGSADWHQGVVGIVAGRLVEYYGKPVILVALREKDEASTGSGRSVPGVELHEALRYCDAELVRHGGHAMAAGVKVLPSKLADFRTKMIEYATQQFVGVAPAPRVVLDAEIPLSALTPGLMKDLDKLEPYGADNPRPRFLATGLTIEGTPKKIGQGERHLSLRLKQGDASIRCIAFGMGDRLEELMSGGGACSIVFAPRINEWQGRRSVEIEVHDFQAGTDVTLG